MLVRLKWDDREEPGAWVRVRDGGQRVFYTQMGYAKDFEDPTFLRLLNNALAWCLVGK